MPIIVYIVNRMSWVSSSRATLHYNLNVLKCFKVNSIYTKVYQHLRRKIIREGNDNMIIYKNNQYYKLSDFPCETVRHLITWGRIYRGEIY